MADFEARVALGAAVAAWADPATATKPSRLNPHQGITHSYYRARIGSPVRVACRVGAVDSPLDASLGGRLFTYWWAEAPSAGGPAIASPPGQSSVSEFTFASNGGYLLAIQRDGGGKVYVHLRCE